jgi:hypothetical protein
MEWSWYLTLQSWPGTTGQGQGQGQGQARGTEGRWAVIVKMAAVTPSDQNNNIVQFSRARAPG